MDQSRNESMETVSGAAKHEKTAAPSAKHEEAAAPVPTGGGEKPPVIRKRRSGGRIRRWIFRLIVLAVLALAVFLLWKHFFQDSRPASGEAQTHRTSQVRKGTLTSELTSSGTISPKDTYSITSLVEGEVISADFEEGDQVTEGQILYQIDVSSMESQLRSAANSLERANNNYRQAAEDYEEALGDYSGNTYKANRTGFVRELMIEVGDKVSNNTELASIYNDQIMEIRVPFLTGEAALIAAGTPATVLLSDTEEVLSGIVTVVSNMDEVLDGGRLVRYVTVQVANPGGLTAEHTATVTVGDLVCSQEGHFEPGTDTTMRAELAGTVEVAELLVHEGDFVTEGTPVFLMRAKDVEDILRDFKDAMDSAQERVDSAQSNVDSTQDNYDNYTITAPISGQVITKSVKAGDNISRGSSGGSTVMAVIYDMSEVTFQMSVDELDVRSVQVGQRVEVTADAVEGKTFTGRVTNISLESSQSNGVTNYPVTVTLDEVGELLPGMNVDGTIILEEAKDALMIPVTSLMRGNRVYVKDDSVTEAEGNVPAGFRSVEVETGLSNDDYIQIVSGLSEGEEVYVDDSTQTSGFVFPRGGPGGMGGMGGMGGAGGQRNQNGAGTRRPGNNGQQR